nr:MAG TPA: hypothetical protein [Caudoviricetes sp.]
MFVFSLCFFCFLLIFSIKKSLTTSKSKKIIYFIAQ